MAYEAVAAQGYTISDDRVQLDLDTIHRFLSEDSYWARGRARTVVERAIANSLCLGLYAPQGAQAGFARAVTDYATTAHLSDVFVLPSHRGLGLGRALVAALLAHPELAAVRRWSLTTDDAHGLYAGFGFGPLARPEMQMIRMLGEDGAALP